MQMLNRVLPDRRRENSIRFRGIWVPYPWYVSLEAPRKLHKHATRSVWFHTSASKCSEFSPVVILPIHFRSGSRRWRSVCTLRRVHTITVIWVERTAMVGVWEKIKRSSLFLYIRTWSTVPLMEASTGSLSIY